MDKEIPSAAREEFTRIVGADYFLSSEETRRRFARTTLPETTYPLGVIQPAHRGQVQDILRVAQTHRIFIYPVSTGKNWGYGDRCASVPDCLILDLSRMNRILEVNTELAYVVLEPGVTQGQLSEYLRANNIPLVMDCTGAGPDAGFIGNTLERGFGHSRYGDHFAHSCNFEVVLPDGSCVSTGLGNFPQAQAQHLYKWGVGPSLDGLFSQSNFGVVTRMTVWLMPKPEARLYYFFELSQAEGMAELVDHLRPLFLDGTLRNVIHVVNESRLLASHRQFPWEEADGKASLPEGQPEVYNRLCAQFKVVPWSGSGVVTGSAAEVKAVRRRLKAVFRRVKSLKRVILLSDRLYETVQWMGEKTKSIGCFKNFHRDLSKLKSAVELLRGNPSTHFLTGAHWRARKPPQGSLDPLDTNAGLIWMGPVLPMTSGAVEVIRTMGDAIFSQFGFEHQLTISFLNARSLAAIVSISFDRSNPEETQRAQACETALLKAYLEKGFIPYRGSASIQRAINAEVPMYWETLRKLKTAWDPHHLLAPGHYLP